MSEHFISTSAAGELRPRGDQSNLWVEGTLVFLGTSSGFPVRPAGVTLIVHTSAGEKPDAPRLSSEAITELRRRTGFTWEQLSRLMGVTLRTVHLWAEGKNVSRANEERLQRFLATIRKIDRGHPSATRAALLGARADGTVPFELLCRDEFSRVEALLESAPGRAPGSTREVLQERKPLAAEHLLDSRHEPAHQESGVTRIAKNVKGRGG